MCGQSSAPVKKGNMRRVFFFVLLLAVLGGRVDAAQLLSDDRGGQPITIKSNELSSDSKSRTATFSGNVTARQGDLTIYADRLTVFYGAAGGEVEKVEASGNVRVVQGDRLATAREGVYLNKEQKIVLTGSPKVFQGENAVSGKVITYYVNEQKSVVTGGADARVEAVIHPKEKGKDDGKKR